MNINITLLGPILALVLAIMILLCTLWELALMYQRKAFKLLMLSVLVMIFSYFFNPLVVASLVIKIIFYYRYWNDKPVRQLFYIQLIPVVICSFAIGALFIALSRL